MAVFGPKNKSRVMSKRRIDGETHYVMTDADSFSENDPDGPSVSKKRKQPNPERSHVEEVCPNRITFNYLFFCLKTKFLCDDCAPLTSYRVYCI